MKFILPILIRFKEYINIQNIKNIYNSFIQIISPPTAHPAAPTRWAGQGGWERVTMNFSAVDCGFRRNDDSIHVTRLESEIVLSVMKPLCSGAGERAGTSRRRPKSRFLPAGDRAGALDTRLVKE